MANLHGGKRPGAGKPKGHKAPQTLAKEAAREAARVLITDGMRPMIQAHLAHACGVGHVYTRDKGGKFNRVEKQDEIDRLLAEGTAGEHFWVFSKDPSPQSFKELMDRALDKPKEQEQEIKITGELTLLDRIALARKRMSKAN